MLKLIKQFFACADGRLPTDITNAVSIAGIPKVGRSWKKTKETLNKKFVLGKGGDLQNKNGLPVPATELWPELVEAAFCELHSRLSSPQPPKQTTKCIVERLTAIIGETRCVGKRSKGLCPDNIRSVLAADESRFKPLFDQCAVFQSTAQATQAADGASSECHFFCLASNGHRVEIQFQGAVGCLGCSKG